MGMRGARRAARVLVVLAGLALAVRRVAADAPQGRFTVQNDGTVLDTRTGLVWQQAVPSEPFTWSEAKSHCAGTPTGLPPGHWRLPSIKEIQTIVDDSRPSPAIDPKAFVHATADNFWSSSPEAGSTSSAWRINFHGGSTQLDPVETTNLARCVR